MMSWRHICRSAGFAGLLCAAQFACAGMAQAGVISPAATLPLLDVPYVSLGGGECFSTAGFCVSPGSLTLTSVVSASFNGQGQDLVANAVFTAQLTTIGGTALGPVSLSGTVEQEVEGRTASNQTGSWTVDLVSLSLSGPLNGNTLTMSLGAPSTGTTSITPIGGGQGDSFDIDSFFDATVDLVLDRPTPLHTVVGPVQFVATASVPEPSGLLMMIPAFLGLAAIRRRRLPD